METQVIESPPELLPRDEFAKWCRSRICPKARVSRALEYETKAPALFLTGCRAWACEVCGPQKRAQLIAKILKAKPQRFLTLTVQAPTPDNGLTWTPREAYDRTRRACSELFKAMNRGRQRTEYCRILEQTKRGYPHYHYLTRGPFWPIDEVREHWKRLTGAYIVDIRRPEQTKQTTTYVAKYLTKGNEVDFTQRRFTNSRAFWWPCETCGSVRKCDCRKQYSWLDWHRYDRRYCWQGHIEEIGKYNALHESPYAGMFWIRDRNAGDDLPELLAEQMLNH